MSPSVLQSSTMQNAKGKGQAEVFNTKSGSFYTISVAVGEPDPIDKVQVECEAHKKLEHTLSVNIKTEDLYTMLGVNQVGNIVSSPNSQISTVYCTCDIPFVHVQESIQIPIKSSPSLTTTLHIPISAFCHVSGYTNGRIFFFPSGSKPSEAKDNNNSDIVGQNSSGEVTTVKPFSSSLKPESGDLRIIKTNHFLYCNISFSVKTTKPINDIPIEIRCPVGQTVSTFIPISLGGEDQEKERGPDESRGEKDEIQSSLIFNVSFVGEGLSGERTLIIGTGGRREKTRYCLKYSPISMSKSQVIESNSEYDGKGITDEKARPISPKANGLVIFSHRTLGSFVFALYLLPLPPTPQKIPTIHSSIGSKAEIICCSVPALLASDINRFSPTMGTDGVVWDWKIVEIEEENLSIEGTEVGRGRRGRKNLTSLLAARDNSISINGFSFDNDIINSGQKEKDGEGKKRNEEEDIMNALYNDKIRDITDVSDIIDLSPRQEGQKDTLLGDMNNNMTTGAIGSAEVSPGASINEENDTMTSSMFDTINEGYGKIVGGSIDKKQTSESFKKEVHADVLNEENIKKRRFGFLQNSGKRLNIISGNSLGDMSGILQNSSFFVRFEAKQQSLATVPNNETNDNNQLQQNDMIAQNQRRSSAVIIFNPSRPTISKAYIRISPRSSKEPGRKAGGLVTQRHSIYEREYLFVVTGVAERQNPIKTQSFESEWVQPQSNSLAREKNIDRTFYATFSNPFCYPVALKASIERPDNYINDSKIIPELSRGNTLVNRKSPQTSRHGERFTEPIEITQTSARSVLEKILNNKVSISGLYLLGKYGINLSPRKRNINNNHSNSSSNMDRIGEKSRQTIILPPGGQAAIKLSYSHIFHRNCNFTILLELSSTGNNEEEIKKIQNQRPIEFRLPISIQSVVYLYDKSPRNVVNFGANKGTIDNRGVQSPHMKTSELAPTVKLSCPARSSIERTIVIPLTNWAYRVPKVPSDPFNRVSTSAMNTESSINPSRGTMRTNSQNKYSTGINGEFGGVVGVEINAIRAESLRLFDINNMKNETELANRIREEEGKSHGKGSSTRRINDGILAGSNVKLPPISGTGAESSRLSYSYSDVNSVTTKPYNLETDKNYAILLSTYIDQMKHNMFDVSIEMESENKKYENEASIFESNNRGGNQSAKNNRNASILGLKVSTTEFPVPLYDQNNSTANASSLIQTGLNTILTQQENVGDDITEDSYNIRLLENVIFGDTSPNSINNNNNKVPNLSASITFSPMRQNDPTKCYISFKLRNSSGAKWRYPFIISSSMPNAIGKSAKQLKEFVIHCASPGVPSAEKLPVRSSSGMFEPFTASFTGHSSQCLAVSPSEGVMSPNAPFIFTVECTMSGYGGDVKGTLLIETQSEQWVFPIRGTLE